MFDDECPMGVPTFTGFTENLYHTMIQYDRCHEKPHRTHRAHRAHRTKSRNNYRIPWRNTAPRAPHRNMLRRCMDGHC